jgi:calnexin
LSENGIDIEYNTPKPSVGETVYFWESFDDPDSSKTRWFVSRAQKDGPDGGSKYDGEWGFQLPQKVIFEKDRALVLKSKAKHAAISAKLETPFEFKSKPLFVQYEVNFQNGMDCGGAYIKLLSQSSGLDLNKFTDKTPYTIMFGPDKCGNDYKVNVQLFTCSGMILIYPKMNTGLTVISCFVFLIASLHFSTQESN